MVPAHALRLAGRLLLVLLVGGWLVACAGQDQRPDGADLIDADDGSDGRGEAGDALDGGDDPDGGDGGFPTTPVTDPTHTGWKQTHCGDCHELPQPGHLVDRVPECAGCHGGNGACDPQGSGRPHLRSDPCLGCHTEDGHGHVEDDCTWCHFADQGVVDCP